MAPADPYRPPATAIGPDDTAVQASLWAPVRWFPAALCVICGLFALLILAIPMHSFSVWFRAGMRPFEQVSPQPGRLIAKLLAIGLIAGVAGVIAFSGARAWMRRRWIWAVLASVLAPLLLVAATALTMSTPRSGLPVMP